MVETSYRLEVVNQQAKHGIDVLLEGVGDQHIIGYIVNSIRYGDDEIDFTDSDTLGRSLTNLLGFSDWMAQEETYLGIMELVDYLEIAILNNGLHAPDVFVTSLLRYNGNYAINFRTGF